MKKLFDMLQSKKAFIVASVVAAIAFLSNLFGMLDGVLSIVDRLSTERPSISINGKWDYEKASKICIKKLRHYGDGKKFGFKCTGRLDCKMQDSIMGFYSMEIDGAPAFIGLTCSRPISQDCHACGVSISIFEFIKQGNGWILNNSNVNAMTTGAWGEPPSIEVENIGYNKYGLIKRSAFSNMGYTEGWLMLFAYIGDRFTPVFGIDSYFENYAGLQGDIGDYWETKLSFVKQGTGFYDFTAITEGLNKGERTFKTQAFRFNGLEYVENN